MRFNPGAREQVLMRSWPNKLRVILSKKSLLLFLFSSTAKVCYEKSTRGSLRVNSDRLHVAIETAVGQIPTMWC